MKIAISIATYNRKKEVKIMANSLFNNLYNQKYNIRIYDDCSSDYGVEFLENSFLNCQIIRRDKNLKADQNMYQIYKDFLDTNDDYLVQLDSDIIFSEFFFEKLEKIIQRNDKKSIFSLYNSCCHREIFNTEEEINNEIFIRKKSIGGICVIFPREIIEDIIQNVRPGEAYDWRWSNYLCKKNYNIYVSKKSYIQHIGVLNGQNSKNWNIDYGLNFQSTNLETLLILTKYQTNILNMLLILKKELPLKEKIKLFYPIGFIDTYRKIKICLKNMIRR